MWWAVLPGGFGAHGKTSRLKINGTDIFGNFVPEFRIHLAFRNWISYIALLLSYK